MLSVVKTSSSNVGVSNNELLTINNPTVSSTSDSSRLIFSKPVKREHVVYFSVDDGVTVKKYTVNAISVDEAVRFLISAAEVLDLDVDVIEVVTNFTKKVEDYIYNG